MRSRSGITAVIAAAVVLIFASQAAADNFFSRMFNHGVEGSGDLKTETRQVEPFDEIDLSGSYDVVVKAGAEQSVTITFDDNLLEFVRTDVRGKTLRIHSDESFSSSHDCRVEITVPNLVDISLSGSGSIDATNLSGNEFNLSISGSGDVTAQGKVDELSVRVSGSGDVDTRRLEAVDADIRVSGSGDVAVNVSGSLDARVSGSGDIEYYGNPESVSSHVSGSGSIRKRS